MCKKEFDKQCVLVIAWVTFLIFKQSKVSTKQIPMTNSNKKHSSWLSN